LRLTIHDPATGAYSSFKIQIDGLLDYEQFHCSSQQRDRYDWSK
jgi:hypothetical protein